MTSPSGPGQGLQPGQQITPQEGFQLLGQGIALVVQTIHGLAQIAAIDQAGNITTTAGQVLPPQPVTIAPPPPEPGLLENPLVLPLLLVGGILLAFYAKGR